MKDLSIDEGLVMASYLKSSKYRYKVVQNLNKHTVSTPTRISQDTGILTSHMSNILKQLKEQGFIECINEDSHKGRLYRLTTLGYDIVNKYLPLL